MSLHCAQPMNVSRRLVQVYLFSLVADFSYWPAAVLHLQKDQKDCNPPTTVIGAGDGQGAKKDQAQTFPSGVPCVPQS